MADKYNSIVTNVGSSYILSNNVYDEGKFKISRIEVCDKQIFDLSEAMNWKTMADGGCSVVTLIDDVEEVNKYLRKIEIDEYTAQLRVTLGPEIGDLNNPTVPLVYGSIGVYLAKYATNGEIEYGKDILWMVGSLDSVFYKYMNSNLTAGNTVSFYLQAAVSNKPEIDHININPTSYYSLPIVDTEQSPYFDPYYNAYGVWNYDESDTPALALRDNSGTKWNYFSTSTELPARSIPGGGIYSADGLPKYVLGHSNGIITVLPNNTVLAFPNGFGSDSAFQTIKTKSIQVQTAEDTVAGTKEVIAIRNELNGSISLRVIDQSELKTDIYQPSGDNLYWYNRSENKTYFIDSNTKTELQFVHIAQYRIVSGQLQYFYPCNVLSGISQTDLALLTDRMDRTDDRITAIDNSAVHIAENETITGQKIFTQDIIIKNTGASVEPNVILSGVADTNCTGAVTFNTRNGAAKSSAIFGVNESNNGVFKIDVVKGAESSTIEIANGSFDMSDDLKYDLTNNIIGYNHQDNGVSKQVIISGKWHFTQGITGTTFDGTSTSSLWADVAEYYEADKMYPAGTLLKFGGEKEVTIADSEDEVESVVSENPGFLLNSDCTGIRTPVALAGKIRIRVIGSVKKGDYIYYSGVIGESIPGVAMPSSKKIKNQHIIGKALESNEKTEEKLVMCVARLSF